MIKMSEVLPFPLSEACIAFTVGKSVELVSPVTYAFPEESTEISGAPSPLLPPRYVE